MEINVINSGSTHIRLTAENKPLLYDRLKDVGYKAGPICVGESLCPKKALECSRFAKQRKKRHTWYEKTQ